MAKTKRWWWYAKVKNSKGVHSVFYACRRPVIGESCPGIAGPNQVVGRRREKAP